MEPVQLVIEQQKDGRITGVGTVVKGVPRYYGITAEDTAQVEHIIKANWPGRDIEYITPQDLSYAFRMYKSKPGDEKTAPIGNARVSIEKGTKAEVEEAMRRMGP